MIAADYLMAEFRIVCLANGLRKSPDFVKEKFRILVINVDWLANTRKKSTNKPLTTSNLTLIANLYFTTREKHQTIIKQQTSPQINH